LGEGDERPKLEALIKERELEEAVALPGFVDNPYKYMKHAAVFVLSSQWEGFGNVLVEAMALGTPVVSTDCPSGPAEILENGKWGVLVPVGDIQQLAKGILSALKKKEINSMPRALMFSVENIMKEYSNILDIS